MADLPNYDARFSSFTQLSGLLASIDGRGTDKDIAAKVDVMEDRIHHLTPVEVLGPVLTAKPLPKRNESGDANLAAALAAWKRTQLKGE